MKPFRCPMRCAAVGAVLDDTRRLWQHGPRHGQHVKTLDAALAEREQVLRMIRAHEAGLRALGVSRLWLFGSLARGEAGADSDVDIMIAIPRDVSSDLVQVF